MSARGGRGGGGRGGARGHAIEIDPELDSLAETAPSETYPPLQPPVAELPTTQEKFVVDQYRLFRRRVHHGDFYTILGDNVRVKKTSSGRPIKEPASAHFDPFEDQPTYGKRFVRRHNTIPRFNKRRFETDYFPPELRATINPEHKIVVKTRTKKAGDWSALTDQEKREDKEDQEEDKEDEDEDKADKEDEDQFSDDDENDDYNAEMYFNDGGDDDDAGDDDDRGEDVY